MGYERKVRCYCHRWKEAVAICARCLKDICEECKTTIEGMVYCRPCADEIQGSREQEKRIAKDGRKFAR